MPSQHGGGRTRRFDLEPRAGIRPGAGELTAAFDFGG